MTLITMAARRLVEADGTHVPLIGVFGALALIATLLALELVRALDHRMLDNQRVRVLSSIVAPQLLAFAIVVATRVYIAAR